jgi:DNA-binding CsgD family transcriptional regulator
VDGLTPKEKEFLGRVANGENGIDIISDRTQLRDTVNSINRKLGQPDLRASADVARRSERFAPPDLDDAKVDQYNRFDLEDALSSLSPQELRVVAIIRDNPAITKDEIGRRMGASPNTVANYLTSIYQKLEIDSAGGSLNARQQLADLVGRGRGAAVDEFFRNVDVGAPPPTREFVLSERLAELTPDQRSVVDLIQQRPRASSDELARQLGLSRGAVDEALQNIYKTMDIKQGNRPEATRQLLVDRIGTQPGAYAQDLLRGLSPQAQTRLDPARVQALDAKLGTLTASETRILQARIEYPTESLEQLGARLGVAESTVGSSLSAIYGKLELPGRTREQLFAALGRPEPRSLPPVAQGILDRAPPAVQARLEQVLPKLTNGELVVLELVQREPNLSPAELASRLGLTESTVRGRLTNIFGAFGFERGSRELLLPELGLAGPARNLTQDIVSRAPPTARARLEQVLPKLTSGELAFLELIQREPGLSHLQIAQRLGTTEASIKTRAGNLYRAFNVEPGSRAGLLNELGLAPVREVMQQNIVSRAPSAAQARLQEVLPKLTRRDLETLEYIQSDPRITNAELAALTGTNERVVKSWVSSIYRGFGFEQGSREKLLQALGIPSNR